MEYYIPGIISKYCADDVIGETGIAQIAASATDSKIKNIDDISYKTLLERAKVKFQILKRSPENMGNNDFFNLLNQTINNNEKEAEGIEAQLEQEQNLEQAILNIERTNMNPNYGATSILASIKKALDNDNAEKDLIVENNELLYKKKKLHFSYTDGFYIMDFDTFPKKKNSISKSEILDILYDNLKEVQRKIKTSLKNLDEQKQEFADFIIEATPLDDHQPDSTKLLKAFKSSYEKDEAELKKANEILMKNVVIDNEDEEKYDIQNENNIDFNFYFQSSNDVNKSQPNDNRQVLLDKLKADLSFLEKNIHQKVANAINSFPINTTDEIEKKTNIGIVNELKGKIEAIEQKFKTVKEDLSDFEKRKLEDTSLLSTNIGSLKASYEEELQKINAFIEHRFPDAPKNSIFQKREDPKIIFQKEEGNINKIEDYYNEFRKKIVENEKLLKEIQYLKANHQNENINNMYNIRQLDEQNQWLQKEKEELEKHIKLYANEKENYQQIQQLNQKLRKDNKELELYNENLKQELNEFKKNSLEEESKTALGVGIATGTIGTGAGIVGGLGFGGVIALGTTLSTMLVAIAAVCLIVSIIAFSMYIEKQNKNEQLTSLINRNKQTMQQKQKYDKQNNDLNNDKPKPIEQGKGINLN